MAIQAPAYNPSAEPARPYVQFEMRATEDRTVPSTDGVTRFVDKAWAIVSAPGSRDSTERLAEDWLAQLKVYAKDDRIPRHWPDEYRRAFEQWKAGEEVSPIGTAIKTWPPLSPAQRKTVIAAGILTVEDLAAMNDETMGRVGMGGIGLKQMAQRWLEESKNQGATAQALADAMLKLTAAQDVIDAQTKALEELRALIPAKK